MLVRNRLLRTWLAATMAFVSQATSDFGDIVQATASDPLEPGLYGPLAIAWHPGAFRADSVRLV